MPFYLFVSKIDHVWLLMVSMAECSKTIQSYSVIKGEEKDRSDVFVLMFMRANRIEFTIAAVTK